MIEQPGCRGGKLISLSTVRGPLESRRKSLQILDSLAAVRLSIPEKSTKSPISEVASMRDRKSTRLNSSHVAISYAVFCLKKKKKNKTITILRNYTSEQRHRLHVECR